MTEVGSDNIALAKGKQSAFAKAVKRVKKSKDKGTAETSQKGQRGIIMLKHIPHGFYEKEIKSYFSQFGKVLRVRVGRSQKTGKSRGYAFVEFQFEDVAKIAAEAMNNYLMFERLIKCEVLPPETEAKKLFKLKHIREDKFPKLFARKHEKAKRNQELTKDEVKEVQQQRLDKIKEQNKRLAELGIQYEFKVGKTEDKETEESDSELNDEEEVVDQDDQSDGSGQEEDDEMEEDSDDEEDLNDSMLEDIASLFPTPVKSKHQSPKTPNVAVTKKKKTPLQNKFSPKMLRSKVQGTPAIEKKSSPGKKASDLPKVSPKQLRSRKSEAVSTTLKEKTPSKSKQSRKSQGQVLQASTPDIKTKPTPRKKDIISDLPKVSPKHLRNRKSQGPNVETPIPETKTPGKKNKSSDLPKISPKLLRSRKSEAVLTPLKEKTPSKPKKGRKSVL
ncbi:unnamed protein product [Orchesella dallaii]|uniref:RRM domain-containing protein n=1 Tax=Orchesella dallaii TaxID=48710 RepID=A0ABP1Q4J0_9HEXA